MLKNAIRNLTLMNTIVFIRRFPLPALLSFVFCIVSISKLAEDKLEETYSAILFCGYFWFIGLKLFAESLAWRPIYYYTVGIAIFLVIACHLYTATNVLITFGFLGAGLFLSIFITPFLSKHVSYMQMWVFNYQLWLHICFTFLTAILLYLGFILVIASLSLLFEIKFYNAIYKDIWFIVATLFSPFLAMAGIPKRFDDVKERFPKALKFILSYIALPLLLIYAIIIYCYIAKILITWDLPRGGVSYMVSAFGCTGIIIYLVSYPLHDNQGIISLFRRYFFKILIMPLILLAIGIGVRIYEYGITEVRYTILLCLIWLMLSTFFILVKPSTQAPKFVFSSIVILLLIASFGPLSAVNISKWSQLHRLDVSLKKNISVDKS